jgi:hypothetical protein
MFYPTEHTSTEKLYCGSLSAIYTDVFQCSISAFSLAVVLEPQVEMLFSLAVLISKPLVDNSTNGLLIKTASGNSTDGFLYLAVSGSFPAFFKFSNKTNTTGI